MATFAQNLVASLTQPSYTQGLLTAAERLGSAPARSQQQNELRLAQEGLFNAMTQAQVYQSEGDVEGLDKVRDQLMETLPTIRNTKLRDSIGESLLALGDMRTSAMPKYTLNQARAYNSAEDNLNSINDQINDLRNADPTIENQQKLERLLDSKDQLTNTIKNLGENADVRIKANEIRFNATLTAIQNEVELTEARTQRAVQQLAALNPESEDYQRIASNPKNASAARIDEQSRLELETARLEAKEIRDRVGDLSLEEITQFMELFPNKYTEQIVKKMNPQMVRDAIARVTEKTAERVGVAQASSLVPSKIRAKVIAQSVLTHVAQTGNVENVPLPFETFRDISDKIDNMDAEELGEFLADYDGETSYSDVIELTMQKLRNKFPRQMKEYDQIYNQQALQQSSADALFAALRSDSRNDEFTDEELLAYVSDQMNM